MKVFEEAKNRLNRFELLYVEDDEMSREVFSRMIRKYFSRIYTASNGKEGFEIYETHRPAVIITDLEMGVMGGLEMSERIRSLDREVPIIAITAFKDVVGEERMRAAGINFFLTKPFRTEELFTYLLARLAGFDVNAPDSSGGKEPIEQSGA